MPCVCSSRTTASNSVTPESRCDVDFSQTRENQLLKNQYGSKSFSRRYELLLEPCYMAPEELDGQLLGREELKRADVFRVGCVVYELFAFKPLFTRLSLEWYVKGSPLNALEVLPEPVKVRIWVCVDSSPSFR